jgi:signal transduction histidine kinase
MVDLTKPRKPMLLPIDAVALVREVVELASGSGRAVSDVTLVYEGTSSAVIRADGAQLRQLVWNLVRNAVQSSNAGDSVRVCIDESPEGEVELSVSDTGLGIDEAAKERLFDAFFTTRSHGTGVGLAVVKKIADEHGFSIRVESTGQGATFRVALGRVVHFEP